MTDQVVRAGLLTQRLALVGKLSALTAEALRLSQKHAGAEMDVLRLELEIGRTGAAEQLVQDLQGAQESAEAIEAERTECDERIAALEDEVEDIDRILASSHDD